MGESSRLKSPRAPGNTMRQVGTELLHQAAPSCARGPCVPARSRRAIVAGAVGQERPQALAVGAQHVGEDVGVGAVVLVAGEPIAAAQCLDVAAGDDDDPQVRTEQGVDDRAVGPLDGDPADMAGSEIGTSLAQTGLVVLDLVTFEYGAVLVDDADRVAPTWPSRCRRTWWQNASVPPVLVQAAWGHPLRDGTCPPVAY